MSRERLYYAILWILAVIPIFIPWATANGKTFIGFEFLFPFGFTYLIGLVIGLVVLITKAKPFVLSLIAGILMITGVWAGCLGMALMGETWGLSRPTASPTGLGFAYIWSIVYTVGASVLGKRMAGK